MSEGAPLPYVAHKIFMGKDLGKFTSVEYSFYTVYL
jgi:hypothetical protein